MIVRKPVTPHSLEWYLLVVLKKARLKRKLSQAQLSKRCNFSGVSEISHFECFLKIPMLRTLHRIAAGLSTDCSTLYYNAEKLYKEYHDNLNAGN